MGFCGFFVGFDRLAKTLLGLREIVLLQSNDAQPVKRLKPFGVDSKQVLVKPFSFAKPPLSL
jgi:hypothetical protein